MLQTQYKGNEQVVCNVNYTYSINATYISKEKFVIIGTRKAIHVGLHSIMNKNIYTVFAEPTYIINIKIINF